MNLRDLTDSELFVQIGGDWRVQDCLNELVRRLAELREDCDEAYKDSRRSLDRVNRLIGGLDESKDLLAAAEADRDRLRGRNVDAVWDALPALLAVYDAAADVLAYIEMLERVAYTEVFDPSPHEMVAPFAAAVSAVRKEKG